MRPVNSLCSRQNYSQSGAAVAVSPLPAVRSAAFSARRRGREGESKMLWNRLRRRCSPCCSVRRGCRRSRRRRARVRSGTAARTRRRTSRRARGAAHHFTQVLSAERAAVILHEDHSTARRRRQPWYHVGSKDEAPGRTGFAHLFEHMMFRASELRLRLRPVIQEVGRRDQRLDQPGSDEYFRGSAVELLETALFMEAGRLGGLLDAMTRRSSTTSARGQNEKRQRLDNQPYGQAFVKIYETMYPPAHPYHWRPSARGDLSAASLEDVKVSSGAIRAETNTSLFISGDFDRRRPAGWSRNTSAAPEAEQRRA